VRTVSQPTEPPRQATRVYHSSKQIPYQRIHINQIQEFMMDMADCQRI